jgi:hypothetical protein
LLREILKVTGPASVPQDADAAEGLDVERVASGLLVLLAFVLPFETPLFHVGPLQITSVELVVYATLAAWGLAVAWNFVCGRSSFGDATATLRADPMVQATVLWGVVLFVSALAAPSYRDAALKFALRSLSGILVFFAARSLVRSPEAARRVVLALLAGAIASATTALIDWIVPGATVWTLFRESTFDTLGLTRATGVFAYPTIGAMYWEAALPLAVVVPLLGSGRDPGARRVVLLSVLASVPLLGAILASATRAGLAGAAVVCAGLVALAWRSRGSLRSSSAAVLSVVLLLGLATNATDSLLAQRLRWWQDDAWFRADYELLGEPPSVRVGEAFTTPLRVRNTGTLTWQSGGSRPVLLGYHWEPVGRTATVGDYEGQRTPLPADVRPSSAIDLVAVARGPASPGVYRLRWDLVQEGVTWFSARGIAMPQQSIVVEDQRQGAAPFEVSAAHARPQGLASQRPAPRPLLWRAALVLWRERPLLGVGPDNFRRRYEDVIGLAPNGRPYSDTRIHANNLYLETLADLGLAGIAALAWLAMGLLRALRDSAAAGRLASLGSGVAAAAFFVHGGIDYFLEFTPLFGLFWLLLGLTSASSLHGLTREARRDNQR